MSPLSALEPVEAQLAAGNQRFDFYDDGVEFKQKRPMFSHQIILWNVFTATYGLSAG